MVTRASWCTVGPMDIEDVARAFDIDVEVLTSDFDGFAAAHAEARAEQERFVEFLLGVQVALANRGLQGPLAGRVSQSRRVRPTDGLTITVVVATCPPGD